MTALAPLVQSFFTDRLVTQRRASPHTVAAYRDAFRLLVVFASQRTGRQPSKLALEDLDAPLVGAFLDHLELGRSNSVATRNARLAALHSFFRYAALRDLANAALIERVLAIPQKRTSRLLVEFLTADEVEALLAAPDRSTALGRRDHALLAVAVQTGLRLSELAQLSRNDVELGTGPYVRCIGKGRKERCTPLTKSVAKVLRSWLGEQQVEGASPVFPGPAGKALSRSAVWRLVGRHVSAAAKSCPSLATKRVSPHTLRHTAAMQLLAAGVDRAVIALWLGHEQVETTQIYLHADLALKQKALDRTASGPAAKGRFHPPDTLLAFLEGL